MVFETWSVSRSDRSAVSNEAEPLTERNSDNWPQLLRWHMERREVEEVEGMGMGDSRGVLNLKDMKKLGFSSGLLLLCLRWAINECMDGRMDEWVNEWINQLLMPWVKRKANCSMLCTPCKWSSGLMESAQCIVWHWLIKDPVHSQVPSWKNSHKFSFQDRGCFQVFPGWSRWICESTSQGGLVLSLPSRLGSEKSHCSYQTWSLYWVCK